MHEFALTQELIQRVEEIAADYSGEVQLVELDVGELTAVNAECMQMAFEALREGTRLSSCRLVCRHVPIEVLCGDCSRSGPPEDPFWLRCAACGSMSVQVVSGRELDIVRVQVEEPEGDEREGKTCTT